MHGSKSRRCSVCSVYWPLDRKGYEPCPECEGATWPSTQEPLPKDDAWSRKTHAEFERWLDEHGRRGVADELERIPVQERAA